MALKTGNILIDSIGGEAWTKPAGASPSAPLVLKYFFDNTGTGRGWTTDEKAQFTHATSMWSNVANVVFLEVSRKEDANLIERKEESAAFDDPATTMVNEGSTTNGDHDGSAGTNVQLTGRYNIDIDWNPGSLAVGGKKFGTFVHEIGHALGLEHPHTEEDDDISKFPELPTGNTNPFGGSSLDHRALTIMSYNGRPAQADWGQNSGPGPIDIAAIQIMYGAAHYASGNTVYELKDTEGPGTYYRTIWDTMGNDTIRYGGSGNATIDLRSAWLGNGTGGGGFLSSVEVLQSDGTMKPIAGGFLIAADVTGFIPDQNGDWGVIIENATGGSGDDKLYGNGVANVLTGGAGNDHLNGFGGIDTMRGGIGDDEYVVDHISDRVVEAAGAVGGTDKVYTSLSEYNLKSATKGANIEILQYIGTSDFTGVGNSLDNIIVGADGNDTLRDDIGNDYLTGGIGNDLLSGGADNDTLVGGAGKDRMFGGTGNDRYEGVEFGDRIFEDAGAAGGVDTITTKLGAYRLSFAANVENLEYTGASKFRGVGNELNNFIRGGSGNDTLNGAAGNDTLAGGLGDDIYELFDITNGNYDTIAEAAGEGHDTVYVKQVQGNAVKSYTLAANVEDGVINDANASGFTLTGNGLNNKLFDDAGGNALDGGAGNDELNGGAGWDFLAGGLGNDKFYLSDRSGILYDVVVEELNGGTDTVYVTSIFDSSNNNSYRLTANVENAEILGTTDFGLEGNALDNTLVGGMGKDTLDGGAGNDLLIGGFGADDLIGGEGWDTALFAGSRGGYSIVRDADGRLGWTLVVNVITGDIDWIQSVESLSFFEGTATLDALIGTAPVTGTEGADTLTGTDLANTINGLGGNDTLDGAAGNDVLSGGAGNDILHGGAGADTLSGGAGNDLFIADSLDIVTGGEGFDTIHADASTATDGYRFLVAGTAIEYVHGHAGNDVIDATGLATDVTIAGSVGNDTLTGGGGNDILDGGAGDDTIQGGGGDDRFHGGAGSDVTEGGVGVDTLYGGDGNDTLNGGAGNDVIFGEAGVDTLNGGEGDDILVVDNSDVVNGGTGNDIANADGSTIATGFIFNLAGTGIEYVNANIGNDVLDATGVMTTVTLVGADGNDTLTGGSGEDTLNGDSYAFAPGGNDTMFGGAGSDHMMGYAGDDVMHGGGSNLAAGYGDRLWGGTGNDTLFGGGGGWVLGEEGDDTLTGADGDLVMGGAGIDTVLGAAGHQQIIGGSGNDLLSGGAGGDRFDFSDGWGHDVVTDFNFAEGDKIGMFDVTGLDSFAQLAIAASGDGVDVSYGADSIHLTGMTAAQVQADWFIL